MRDARDERYAEELTARIDAHIAGFSLAKKITYSALACIPIVCAVYGFNGLLRSCPGDQSVKSYVGFMLIGMIVSLFSLVWFLLYFSKFTTSFTNFIKNNRSVYLFTIIAVVFSLKLILYPVFIALEKEEATRCHVLPRHTGT